MKVITIGRGPENNVVIDDYKISRTHLQIVENNGVYSIVDLNSANGTYVNGQRISGEVRLQPNDVVKIGDTTLQWQKYFNAHTAPEPSTTLSNPTITPKRQSWVCYAVAGVLVVLVGIVFGIIVSKNKQKLAQKDDELRDISNTLEETRKQKTELEKELNALEGYSEDFAQIAKDNKLSSDEQIKRLIEANKGLIATNKKQAATNKRLEDELSKANTEISTLKNKEGKLKKDLETANTKISDLNRTQDALNDSLTKANGKVGELEKNVQKLTSANETLQQEKNDLAEQVNANRSQLQTEIKKLKDDNKKLRQELDECQSKDSIAAIEGTEDKANAQSMAEVAEQKPITSGVNSEDNNNAEQQNNK